MQFLVIGKDGTDNKAESRRLAAREQHITMGDKLLKKGNLWYGAALTNEQGNMIGSMYMLDFPSQKEFEAQLSSFCELRNANCGA